jgi:hypothetical protein
VALSTRNGSDTEWTTVLFRGDDAFSRIADDWDGLYGNCSTATPFQSRTWLESWWRCYRSAGGRLCLVGVRHRGRLVAAAALVRRWRGPWRVLSPVGVMQSDYCDILVDDTSPGTPDPVHSSRELAAVIRSALRFDALDFRDVRPSAALAGLHRRWPYRTLSVPGMICLSFPAVPMEEFLRSLNSKARHRIHLKLKKIDESAIEVRRVPPEEGAQATAELFDLHRRQWAGRKVSREHLKPRFQNHLATVAGRGRQADFEAAVFEYSRKNPDTGAVDVLAVDIVLLGRGLAGDYLYGYDPDIREEVDASTMFLRTNLDDAAALGLSEVSLLRGAETHKYRLKPPTEARNSRLLMAAGPWGTGWLLAVRFRSFAVRTAKELVSRWPGGSRRGMPSWTAGWQSSATPPPDSSPRWFRRACRGWRSNAASK